MQGLSSKYFLREINLQHLQLLQLHGFGFLENTNYFCVYIHEL